MSTGILVHFFDEQGQMTRISTSSFEKLTSTDSSEHFKNYAGQRVRCAVSLVQLEIMKVKRIAHTSYAILNFDLDGNFDLV